MEGEEGRNGFGGERVKGGFVAHKRYGGGAFCVVDWIGSGD